MNKQIEVQQDNIKTLIHLATKNPDLRIVPLVDSEIVASDDFGWWTAEWGTPSIEELWGDDERVYIRSDDEEELVDEAIEMSGYDLIWSEEDAQIKGKEIVDAYDWEQIIAVRIRTI